MAPSHPGVHLCAKALGFFFQLQHSSVLWWIASVRLGSIQSSDAQHGCTSEWTADSVNVVQHKTCHGVGWRCKSRILADQFVWKHGVILHRFATTTSNQLIVSCNLFWMSARLLNEIAFSRNLENWYLPMCNFRSPWILGGRPQCQITCCVAGKTFLNGPKCNDFLWRCNFLGWAGPTESENRRKR